MKSSICFTRKLWSEEASAAEMPVAGAAVPRLINGFDEVKENEGGADVDEDEDGVIKPEDAVDAAVKSAEDAAAAAAEVAAAEEDVGVLSPGKPANRASWERPEPRPAEERVERPKRLAPPPPRLGVCLTLECN